MFRMPFRAAPGLGCTVKLTLPFPVPFVPPTIEIHGTLVVAVHVQLAAAVTVTAPDPPAPLIEVVIGDS